MASRSEAVRTLATAGGSACAMTAWASRGSRGVPNRSQRDDAAPAQDQRGQEVHHGVGDPPGQVAAEGGPEHGADLRTPCGGDAEGPGDADDHDEAEQDLGEALFRIEEPARRAEAGSGRALSARRTAPTGRRARHDDLLTASVAAAGPAPLRRRAGPPRSPPPPAASRRRARGRAGPWRRQLVADRGRQVELRVEELPLGVEHLEVARDAALVPAPAPAAPRRWSPSPGSAGPPARRAACTRPPTRPRPRASATSTAFLYEAIDWSRRARAASSREASRPPWKMGAKRAAPAFQAKAPGVKTSGDRARVEADEPGERERREPIRASRRRRACRPR